jgi:hypothetical protein
MEEIREKKILPISWGYRLLWKTAFTEELLLAHIIIWAWTKAVISRLATADVRVLS